MEILTQIYEWFAIFAQVVTIASMIAPITDWKGDDKFVKWAKPIVETLSLSILRKR